MISSHANQKLTAPVDGLGELAFDLDGLRRAVRIDGREVALGGRGYDLLSKLASEPGRVFSPRELEEAVWPGLVVEDNNLRVQIAALRRRIGASSIVNVARRGYALAAPQALPAPRSVAAGSIVEPRPSVQQNELRPEDFRAIFHLLGECEELWIDPQAWQAHLIEGAARMVGLPVGLHADVDRFHPGHQPMVVKAFEHGWQDPDHKKIFQEGHPRSSSPFDTSPLDHEFRRRIAQGGALTLSSGQILDEREWKRSEFYNLFHRASRMDQTIHSAVRTGPEGRYDLLVLGGAGPAPSLRNQQLIAFLHAELVNRIGSRLATEEHASMRGLDLRQRHLLGLLASGLSASEIAASTGAHRSGVQAASRQICAHFDVRSLAQLQAYLTARRPKPSNARVHGQQAAD